MMKIMMIHMLDNKIRIIRIVRIDRLLETVYFIQKG